MKNWILILAFLAFSSGLESAITWEKQAEGGFSAKINISTEELSLQDELGVELILNYPPGYSFDKNTLSSNLLQNPTLNPSPFVAVSEKVDIKNGSTILHYILDPQIPGTSKISFYDITFTPDDPKQNKPVTLTSDLFTIKVTPGLTNQSYVPSPADLMTFSQRFPIEINSTNKQALQALKANESSRNQEIMRERTLPWSRFLWALIGIGLLTFLRYRAKDEKPDPMKKILTAQGKALEHLQEIQVKDLIQKQDYAEYYKELSDTVRFYIEDRFQLNAPTKTTQEFLQDISAKPVPEQLPKEALIQFLMYSDLVKFGKFKPTQEDCTKAFNAALNFIEKG